MPSHWGHTRLNIPSQSSATGTQCLHAVGCAEAGVIYQRVTAIPDRESHFHDDEVTYLSIGDGATSEGEFWESLNTTCTKNLPILYLVEDNGYAISVPVEVADAGRRYLAARRALSRPADLPLRRHRLPGQLPDAAATPWRTCARGRARHSSTPPSSGRTRTRSRTMRSCTRRRRSARRRRGAIRCVRMRHFLKVEGPGHRRRPRGHPRVGRARGQCGRRAGAGRAKAGARDRHAVRVLSGRRSLVSGVCDRAAAGGRPGDHGRHHQRHPARRDGARSPHRRLRRGRGGREPRRSARQRGRQGRRLQGDARAAAAVRQRSRLQLPARRSQHHRPRRRDGAPRPEAGRRDPVLRLHLARVHADPRRDVDDAVPVEQQLVVPDGDPRADRRATCAAARRITASPGSRSSRTRLASGSRSRRTRRTRPGCCARRFAATTRCCSSNTSTCTARPTTRARIPATDYTIPFGKAAVAREGADVVIFTWGALVQRSLLAAQQAEHDGISVAVIDLRTIIPYDWDTIAAYTRKTSRVIVAHEDQLTCGFGAEIAARISQELFEYLDAPVTRVAALDCPVAYAPVLEEVDPAGLGRRPEGDSHDSSPTDADGPRPRRCSPGAGDVRHARDRRRAERRSPALGRRPSSAYRRTLRRAAWISAGAGRPVPTSSIGEVTRSTAWTPTGSPRRSSSRSGRSWDGSSSRAASTPPRRTRSS